MYRFFLSIRGLFHIHKRHAHIVSHLVLYRYLAKPLDIGFLIRNRYRLTNVKYSVRAHNMRLLT